MRPEDAAHKSRVSVEKIHDWEDGSDIPTVPQARKLASIYGRPFLEFLFPDVPILPEPRLAPDFRFHRVGPSDTEEVALKGVQEWAETQRQNALDLYAEIGETPLEFPKEIKATMRDSATECAGLAREFIGLTIDTQTSLNSRNRHTFPNILRKHFEAIGVLVFKQSGLSSTRTRGICLYADVLPIIVFGNESPGAQAFTLSHEFAHVVLGESALSGSPRPGALAGSSGKKVEIWCNNFAAAFLMPERHVRASEFAPNTRAASISDFALDKLAKQFAVSQHAMLIRLTNIGLVDIAYYWRVKRPQFLAQESSYTGGGRSVYYGSRFRNQLGDRYTGLVLEALETGRIGHHNASEFMGIKNVRHLLDIQEHFAR